MVCVFYHIILEHVKFITDVILVLVADVTSQKVQASHMFYRLEMYAYNYFVTDENFPLKSYKFSFAFNFISKFLNYASYIYGEAVHCILQVILNFCITTW